MDYQTDLYKAICCKNPTKGSEVFVDDFGDVYLLYTATNKLGQLSTYRNRVGQLVFHNTPGPIATTASGQYLLEVLPAYYAFMVYYLNTPALWAVDVNKVSQYIHARIGKVKTRYYKKPKSCAPFTNWGLDRYYASPRVS